MWYASSFAVSMNSTLLAWGQPCISFHPSRLSVHPVLVQSSSDLSLGKARGSLLKPKKTLCQGSGLCITTQGCRNPSVNCFKWQNSLFFLTLKEELQQLSCKYPHLLILCLPNHS